MEWDGMGWDGDISYKPTLLSEREREYASKQERGGKRETLALVRRS